MFTRFNPVLPGLVMVCLWLSTYNRAQAQLSVGATGMFIKSNTTIVVDSLVMQPSTDLTLSNLNITHTAAPLSGTGGNSIRRVYEFSQPVSFTGVIGLYYAEHELNGNTEPNLALSYLRASDNMWITTTGSSVDPAANYLMQSFTMPPVLKITATSNGVILPILLTSYYAKAVGDKVKLEWQTSLEQDADRFVIERSTDGRHFSLLTSIKCANIPTGSQYTAYDDHPSPGYNYYRLLQYDLNGGKKDFGVRTVLSGADNNLTITAYPNPVTQALNLRLQPVNKEQLHVTLFSAQGAMVYYEAIQLQPGQSNYPLQIKTMPPRGEYYLRVTTGNGVNRVLKISIQ